MTRKNGAVEWVLHRELRYRGVIYSKPEAVPDMPIEEALEFERLGVIGRPGVPVPARMDPREIALMIRTAPTSASQFLEHDPFGTLFLLRVHRPPVEVVREVLDLAVAGRRPPLLIEALKMVLDIPLSADERADYRAAGVL